MKRLLPLFALFALVSCLAPSSPDQEPPGSSSAPYAWIHFTRFDRDVALYNGFYIYYTHRGTPLEFLIELTPPPT